MLNQIQILFMFAAMLITAPVFSGEAEEGGKEWMRFVSAFHAIQDYLAKDEIIIPGDIMKMAELGDHFETINLDRPDKHSAFGNPDARWFHSVKGSEAAEHEFGSFGHRDGGGRRLMVTKRCCELSQAIIGCARAGYERKVQMSLTKEQIAAHAQHIEALGSPESKKRDAATGALLTSGRAAVNGLIDALNETKDTQLQYRIRLLLQRIQLRMVVDKFRLENPESKK